MTDPNTAWTDRMSIRFEIPDWLADQLRAQGVDDLSGEAKEAVLTQFYRLGRLSHDQLARGLGLGRPEVDAILKRRKVPTEGRGGAGTPSEDE